MKAMLLGFTLLIVILLVGCERRSSTEGSPMSSDLPTSQSGGSTPTNPPAVPTNSPTVKPPP